MSVRTKLAGLYVDNLRYTNPAASMVLINTVPADTEDDVPVDAHIRFTAASLTNNPPTLLIVNLSRSSDASIHNVYDSGAGGFLGAWTGTLVQRASSGSGVNDEWVITIVPPFNFSSLETITIQAVAESLDGTFNWQYSFVVQDLTAPGFEAILWLTPTRALVKFDEPVSTLSTPGGSQFISYHSGNVEVVDASTIQLSGGTPLASWIGCHICLQGSAFPENNAQREIVSVNGTTRRITVDTAAAGTMVADDGLDYDDDGILVRHRVLRASISSYRLSFRGGDEGASAHENSDLRVQCGFEPLVKAAEVPDTSEVPAGDEVAEYVFLDFDEDVSYGRLYTLHGYGIEDNEGNAMSGEELEFETPWFEVPIPAPEGDALGFWSDGIIPATDRKDDMESGGHLRRAAAVLQDGLNLLHYRRDQLQYLDDPHRCPEGFLDHMLYNRGNPFRFPMDSTMKRRVAAALPDLYRQRATVDGIREALYRILGYEFIIQPYVTAEAWILGDTVYSKLGFTTALGPSEAYARNCYEIISPVDLTDDELRIVIEVAQWADPCNMHLIRIIQPSTGSGASGATGTVYWVLGTSVLGFTTTLSS